MPQMVVPDFMPQIVWLCIVFPLLYFSMRYIALPRISDIISRREEKIRNDISKAEEIRKKIEQTNNELQIAIDNTNNEIQDIVSKIYAESEKETEAKLEKSKNTLNQKLEDSKKDIKQDIQKFQKNIDIIAAEATEKILEKVLYKLDDSSVIKDEVSKEKERLRND